MLLRNSQSFCSGILPNITRFLIFLAIFNCASFSEPEKKSDVSQSEKTVVPGCEPFATLQDCISSKEINSTLAYYNGLFIANRIPRNIEIYKIKNSEDLIQLKKQIISEGYFFPKDPKSYPDTKEVIQYIQDSFEAAQNRSTPRIIKAQRIEFEKQANARRIQEQEERKKSELESLKRDIYEYPYSFEIVCISPSEDLLFLSDCSALKPSLYVYQDGQIFKQYSSRDFEIQDKIKGKLPSNYKLELKSESGDSKNLFRITTRERTVPGEPLGRILSSKGNNLNLSPN